MPGFKDVPPGVVKLILGAYALATTALTICITH